MKSCSLFVLALLIFSCVDSSKKSDPSLDNSIMNYYDGPIIDMHIHAYSEESGGFFFGVEHPRTLRGETYSGAKNAEELKEKTFARFEKHNIVKAVVTDGGVWKEDIPEKLIIANSKMSPAALRQKHKDGELEVLAELSPFYQGMKADNRKLKPYFNLATELQIPVGFHIFPGGPPGGLYQMGLTEMRVANAHPEQLEEVLVAHPGMKVYIMHGGWPFLDEMKALMYTHPQIYVDIAVINWILPEAEFHKYLKGLVDAGFGKRILYGTDQMVWPQTIDIGIASVNSAEFLSWDQKEDIFFNNAAHFLELDVEEITRFKHPPKEK